jgi:hypothetical protein
MRSFVAYVLLSSYLAGWLANNALLNIAGSSRALSHSSLED